MTAATSSRDDYADQALSPELALVDAELARWARERLPYPTLYARDASEARVAPHSVSVADVAPDRAAFGDVPAASMERPRRRALVWALISGALFGAAAVGGWSEIRHVRRDATSTPSVAGVAVAPRVLSNQSTAAPKPTQPARTTRTTRSAPGPPAKRFVWVRNTRASYYKVQFFRNGTKILETRVSQPVLLLPGHWTYRGHRYTLSPGRYTWIVRPGFGRMSKANLGEPIVRSSLVVK